MMRKREQKLAASIMCADFLHLADTLTALEQAGVAYIHCDMMDNHFVPNLMLPPEFCNKIRIGSSLPFDYHIMCEKPESVLERLTVREGDFVSVHAESTVHLQRVLTLAKSMGARPAVALNPATPLCMIEEILPDIDMVLAMTVNPGFAGQKLVPQSLDKISRLRTMLDQAGYPQIAIEADGNCSFENLPKMYRAGAELFVVGTSSIFHKNETVMSAADKIAKGWNL